MQFLDKVVDVPVVPQPQCVDKVVAVLVVLVVLGLPSLFFDKVVDMPVIVQLQYVDKLVISLLCRSCVFRGARRGEDSPIPQLQLVENLVEIPENEYICKVFTRRQAVAAWRRVKEPSTTKSSSSSRAEAVLFSRQTLQFRN